MKLPEKKINIGKVFLKRTLVTQMPPTDKWDFMELKHFCTAKDIIYLKMGKKSLLAIHSHIYIYTQIHIYIFTYVYIHTHIHIAIHKIEG